MKTKLFGVIVSVAIGGLASIGAANAATCPVSDTCVTYNVFGSFADLELQYSAPYVVDPGPVSLGGTLYIDVTAGTVISADLTIPGFNFTAQSISAPAFAPLNNIYSQYTVPNVTGLLYELNVSSLPGDLGDTGYIDFIVVGDQSNPLIGNPFITIDQGEFTEPFGNGDYYIPFGLTGYIQATPLPAALPLFATGLGLTGLLGWRRKRKTAA